MAELVTNEEIAHHTEFLDEPYRGMALKALQTEELKPLQVVLLVLQAYRLNLGKVKDWKNGQ